MVQPSASVLARAGRGRLTELAFVPAIVPGLFAYAGCRAGTEYGQLFRFNTVCMVSSSLLTQLRSLCRG